MLRGRGVPATTIHRILYTPLYHPDYEAIAEWLTGKADAAEGRGADRDGARPGDGLLPPASVDPRGAGQRRAARLGLHQGLEAPRRAARHRADRRGLDARRAAVRRSAALFRTLVLFGDPAQLAPVGGGGGMVFDTLPERAKLELSRVHRQAADSPILDLAHALGDPEIGFARLRGAGRATRRARDRAGGDQRRGSTRARWRGRRCWSGATPRGCG